MPALIGTSDALANKQWGKDLFMDSLNETYFWKFQGSGPNAMIRLLNETSKRKGDTITVPYVGQLSGLGKTENETLYNNEENSTYYNDSLTINELWHATEVKGEGTIDPQRVPFDMKDAGRELLQMWFTQRYDVALFRHLCGYNITSPATPSSKLTLFNTPTAPTNKVLANAITVDESLTSVDVMSLPLIDKALLTAKLATPLIKPLMVGGKKMYVLFLHPIQVRDLETSTTEGNWFSIQKAAIMGGQVTDNPIFTGALGVYKNVIIHESEYVTTGVHSSTGADVTTAYRAVLCGANAGAVAFGDQYGDKQMSWREELKDYQRVLGIGAGIICGVNKLTFNGSDNGVVVISTFGSVSGA